jgi:hypothetical protein
MDAATDNLVVRTAIQIQPISRTSGAIGRIAGIFHLNIEVMELKAGFANGLDGDEAAGVGFRGTALTQKPRNPIRALDRFWPREVKAPLQDDIVLQAKGRIQKVGSNG